MTIFDSWLHDFPQQFLGQPKIEVLVSAFAKQLQELEQVFSDINEKPNLETATGVNLDYVGTIIPLTRKEAAMLAGKVRLNPSAVMSDDEAYRRLLKYQRLVNTNACTYYDLMEDMLFLLDTETTSLRYEESPQKPATIILKTPVRTLDDDFSALMNVAFIRPAGVGAELHIDAKAEAAPLNTLIGSDTGKSARIIANEELAAQWIPANAQEALDSLQEIAAWIQSHPNDVAAIWQKLTLGANNGVEYATVKAYVEAMVSGLITLSALSAAVSGNGNAVTGVNYDNTTGAFTFTKGATFLTQHQDISGKVDKVSGKQLSTEDYTTEEKNKLSGIAAQANKTTIDATLSNAGQAADAKTTGDGIAALEAENARLRNYLASMESMEVYRTASGNPATFNDAKAANVRDLTVTITPTQSGSGNPSPDNVRLITGVSSVTVTRTGKNLLPSRQMSTAVNLPELTCAERRTAGLSYDLSAVNSTIASVQQTLGNYGTRIAVLEQGGIPTTTLEALNDALFAVRQTQAGYGTRIAALEDADHTVNLAPLEGRVGALESILPDVLPVANGLNGRVAALERSQAAHNGFTGQLDALETLVGNLSARLNALSSTVDELENISGIADTITLSNQISALSRRVASDMTLLSNRVASLENSSFADLSANGASDEWYAYNVKGDAVDGPFGFGFGNNSRTLAEFFNLEPDSGNNSGGVALEPERPNTLAELFGFDIE